MKDVQLKIGLKQMSLDHLRRLETALIETPEKIIFSGNIHSGDCY